MSNYKTMAKRPGGTEYELVEMVDNYYGPHRYGVRFPEGKVYKVYPEDKCEFMNKERLVEDIRRAVYFGEIKVSEVYSAIEEGLDDRNKDMNGKSPLDEFIDERIELLRNRVGDVGGFVLPFVGYNAEKFLSDSIRLAVQKHAEAVIPEKIEMKHISDSSVALRNGVIEEIKSASDKWRGV